jgi:hypothetical protein
MITIQITGISTARLQDAWRNTIRVVRRPITMTAGWAWAAFKEVMTFLFCYLCGMSIFWIGLRISTNPNFDPLLKTLSHRLALDVGIGIKIITLLVVGHP